MNSTISTNAWNPLVPYSSTGASSINAMAVADGPANAPADPKAPWMKCNDAFAIVDGVAQALYQLILGDKIPIGNVTLKNDLVAALFAMNTGLHDVSIAFKAYIDNNTPFTIEPPVVNTWPKPTDAQKAGHLGYFQSAFEVMGGALSMLSKSIESKLAQNPEAQAAFDALTVLVNDKDAILDRVKAILADLQPAATPT